MASLRVNGRPVAVRELGCRHLSETSRGRFVCAVYERRFDEAPWCLTVAEARAQGVLAGTCPFRGDDAAPAPQVLHPRLVRGLAPQLRQAFVDGWPAWVDGARVPDWLRGPRAD